MRRNHRGSEAYEPMISGEFGNSMQRKFRSIEPSFADDHGDDENNVMLRVSD